MHLYQQPLGADDLDRAVAFWTAHLGATHLATFAGAGLAFVDVDGTRIMFERGGDRGRCYLATEDAAATVERLVAAGAALHSPVQVIFEDETGLFGAPAAEYLGMVLDSEGNAVGLMHRGPLDDAE